MIRTEDEQKINQMVIALKWSKEQACILLVLYNDELLRQDVEVELKRRLEPDFNFRELRMTEDMYRNVPVIITRDMNPQPNDVFLVYDLKKALPEVLEYLNYRREDFVEHKISVIFWLDEPTLIEIMRKALDFFAFRAAPVIEFMSDRSKDMIIPGRTTPSEIFIYNSLEELDKKIALREEMLKDYLEKRPQDKSTIASLHGDLGVLYRDKSNLDKSLEHYQKSLEFYREIKYKKGEAGISGNIGLIYQDKGELDKAINYFSQALDIFHKVGDIHGEAINLANIGGVYHKRNELNKALEYISKGLDLYHRIGDVRGEAIQQGNMGLVYQNMGELDNVLEYYSKALEIFRRISDAQGEARTLGSIGLSYRIKGNLDKALEYYLQALEMDRKIGYVRGEATQLSNIGSLYYAKGELDKALECHSQAFEIFHKLGYSLEEAMTLGNMSLVYQTKGELNKALTYMRKTIEIFISTNMVNYADKAYRNLQEIISQMKSRGIEISQEDMKETTELTEQYEKLKVTVASTSAK